MRILFVCQYFAPEPGAPQARLLETGRALARAGLEVAVLTGFPNHPTGILAAGDRGRLFRRERMDDVEVLRTWLFATPNRGFGRKTLGHLSFMASAMLLGGARARRPDVVVASSPTFFGAIAGWVLSVRWRVPFVFEVRDLWPAIFTQLGVLERGWLVRALEFVELFLYRRAAKVVTVTEGFRKDISSRGIDAGKVVTITNGVDTVRFHSGGDAGEARRELGLQGKFVILYLGAHGVSHALGKILDVAGRWVDDPSALFLFVGEGAEKDELVSRARAAGLLNVRFTGAVPRERVPLFYRAADVGLVPLRDVPLFSAFIPSKMFELLSAGVPIVASLRGEPAEILDRSGGAVVVPPEDVTAIDAALRRLRRDPAERRRMAARGVEFVRRNYDRAALAMRYADVLRAAVREGRR
ncbi:MAG: glycosyltransferase family 4 protein [Planctomycetes bacterium]|nr:glycosyltransferase family 4 protein [Planctomycetota bacterium]